LCVLYCVPFDKFKTIGLVARKLDIYSQAGDKMAAVEC